METGFEDYTKRIDGAVGHCVKRSVSVDDDIFNQGICMPSDTKMTDGEQERVINVVRKVMETN